MTEWSGLALKWSRNGLLMLDQRLLPDREVWLEISGVEQMARAIELLQVRGAPLIGVAAALSLADLVLRGGTMEEFERARRRLRAARPTAVNLMWAMDRLAQAAEQSGLNRVPEAAFALVLEDVELCDKIANHGAALIDDGDQILTHCNTGGLATAGIGTALGAVRRAHELGKKIHVWVDETRPLLQGGRLTTYELTKLGVPFTLIADNMAASLMAQGRVSKVIVGSDRIAANGDFANKIGTYSLAVSAHYHRIPFFVAAPFSTVDLNTPRGSQIPIEERAGSEVRGVSGSFGEVRWAPEKCDVYNPCFDVTPAHLVTAWILDSGVLTRNDVSSGQLEKMMNQGGGL